MAMTNCFGCWHADEALLGELMIDDRWNNQPGQSTEYSQHKGLMKNKLAPGYLSYSLRQ